MAGDNPPPDPPSDKKERLLARAASSKPPDYPASATGGTLSMSVQGRFDQERARLSPDFTEADRQWRRKWHRDQILHPDEPGKSAEEAYNHLLRNPIRRFYRIPLDYVEKRWLIPAFGRIGGKFARGLVPLMSGTYLVMWLCWYQMKYHHGTWEKTTGLRRYQAAPEVLPGDPRYPLVNPRTTPQDYYEMGYKTRTAFKDPLKGSFSLELP